MHALLQLEAELEGVERPDPVIFKGWGPLDAASKAAEQRMHKRIITLRPNDSNATGAARMELLVHEITMARNDLLLRELNRHGFDAPSL